MRPFIPDILHLRLNTRSALFNIRQMKPLCLAFKISYLHFQMRYLTDNVPRQQDLPIKCSNNMAASVTDTDEEGNTEETEGRILSVQE